MERATFSRRVRACFFLLAMLLGTAIAQQKRTDVEPVQTTVCTILRNPVVFNGKMVEVRGTIVRNYEWAIIKSHGCGGGIDFEYPDQLEKPVRFSLLKDAEYERFEDGLAETKEPSNGEPLMHPDYKNDVTATFIGRLDGCPTNDRSAKSRCGFGHLGQFSARLIIRQVKQVEVSLRQSGPQLQSE